LMHGSGKLSLMGSVATRWQFRFLTGVDRS
jgi:hypothetical protein